MGDVRFWSAHLERHIQWKRLDLTVYGWIMLPNNTQGAYESSLLVSLLRYRIVQILQKNITAGYWWERREEAHRCQTNIFYSCHGYYKSVLRNISSLFICRNVLNCCVHQFIMCYIHLIGMEHRTPFRSKLAHKPHFAEWAPERCVSNSKCVNL